MTWKTSWKIRSSRASEGISDDIVVFSQDLQEHDSRQHHVLLYRDFKLLMINGNKCDFRISEMEFMGHVFITITLVKPNPRRRWSKIHKKHRLQWKEGASWAL